MVKSFYQAMERYGISKIAMENDYQAMERYGTSSTAQGGGGSFKNRKPIGEVGCCESGMSERSH